MKQIFHIIVLSFLFLTGCMSQNPTCNYAYSTSKTTGTIVGNIYQLVNQRSSSDHIVLVEIQDVMTSLVYCIPGTNATFTSSWNNKIEDIIKKDVSSGKLTSIEGAKARNGAQMLTKALDFIFIVKHPSWKKYEVMKLMCVQGVTDGFSYSFLIKSNDQPVEDLERLYKYLEK